jgi:hypothetical protein
MRRTLLPALGLILLPFATRAQRPLAERIHSAGTKTISFEARSRPEVCGDGITSYNDGLSPQRTRVYDGYNLLTHEPWDTHIPPCEKGPVRVTVRVVEGTPSWLRVAAGPLAAVGDTVTDLGSVSIADARAFLEPLALAADGRSSLEAIMPLVLIDSVPRWDILQRVARDSTRLTRYRRRAADLLARGAANTIAQEPNVDDDTRTTRREAVYAIARQQPRNSDVIPDLLTIAKSNPHRDARVAALYQLGQMADARAVDLFTTMLRGQP